MPGDWNMACDAALLDSVGGGGSPPTLRFYGWDPPAVSLGRHQPDADPGAAAVLAAAGVDLVRRPTGGRAVYHGGPDEELTYSVVVPLGRPPADGPPREACRRIHAAFAVALRRLGVPAELAQGGPSRADGAPRSRPKAVGPRSRLACFAARAPHEILARRRKLLGSAQRRTRAALLQHGSLPLYGEQAILDRAWPGSLAAGRATTVRGEAGRAIPVEEAAEALARAFAESLGARLQRGGLLPAELERIEAAGEARLVRLDTLSRGVGY